MSSTTINILAMSIQAKINVYLESDPGEAKSSVVEGIGEALGKRLGQEFPVVTGSLAQLLPEEFTGAQVPNHDKKMMEPYAMGLIRPIIEAKRGIFFGDEASSAPAPTRGAMLTVAESKLFGAHRIKDCVIVLAGNPIEYATAGGLDFSPADFNRYLFLAWELDMTAWGDWMMGGDGALASFPIVNQKELDALEPKMKMTVFQFVKRNPNMKNELQSWRMAPETSSKPFRVGPFASPRSWAKAAVYLAACKACGFDLTSDEAHLGLTGLVGRTAADMFVSWVRDMDLPDPEVVLANPGDLSKLPANPAKLAVCIEAVCAAAVETGHKDEDRRKRWAAAGSIVEKLLDNKPDLVQGAAAILCDKTPPGQAPTPWMGKLLEFRRKTGLSAPKR